MDINWPSVVVATLTGGFAGAVFNHLVQWWRSPEIIVVFDSDQPGCEVKTPIQGGAEPVQKYLRLRIKNEGQSTANNVAVCVTRIRRFAGGEPEHFDEEVLDLKLSLTGEPVFRLAAGSHRFVDLCLAMQIPHDGVYFSFDFLRNPVRMGHLFQPGRFTAEIFVTADGAKSVRATLTWDWDGTLDGLRIVGFGYMF